MKQIVVGLDGSDGATAALRWAAETAACHGARLSALLAWDLLGQPGHTFSPAFGESDARAALEGWVADVTLEVPVACEVVNDLPGNALIERSADADLVVVGSRGMGGFKALLLGSVSSVVAERALCPVAVVRPTLSRRGPVVVGVDGVSHSTRVVELAANEARARSLPLELVHAYTASSAPVLGLPAVIPLGHAAEEAAEHRLAQIGERVDLSGIDVRHVIVDDSPAGALVDASERASMVVVGSRGRGSLAAVLLGSTSRHLLHHAVCPVVVVR